ncbi:hypothetical protein, conserved [Trypanosoma brucei brucei TREU927]|uniref:Uncharacterized protein n=1 Tax=Trypanosoma brucei brucei (strain 927/4 GUTat10.1) TaxID=185431 RepID=Q382T5_TRYB2|nr:hypothetical protein, conserved [Trypanosoma brucei brucei TREU927]EAN80196.1 hypothetical protein, conserved [Trypanosoma brucei brucei TREU927]
MFYASEEGLRTAELAGRMFYNLGINSHGELQDIHQLHTGHVGGACLDNDIEAAYLGGRNRSSAYQPSGQRCKGDPNANLVVEVARRESVLRQVYNDKLRGSIQAIITALADELPRDHIFLQLLNDASTQQYCRVRVGEVVEAFLFSVQAHQYHNLASELAKREVELLALASQLEMAEKQPHVSLTPGSVKSTQTESYEESNGVTEENTPSCRGTVVGDATDAQAELFGLLDEMTREHELAKFRECLSAPTSLLETVQAVDKYADRYEYLSDIVSHLFRSIRCLVMYAEGSLNSISALRRGSHNVRGVGGSRGASAGRESSSPQSPEQHTTEEWQPLTLGGSPPQKEQRDWQNAEVLRGERNRLRTLVVRLKHAESHCGNLIQSMSTCHMDLRKRSEVVKQQTQRLAPGSILNVFTDVSRGNEEVLEKLDGNIHKTIVTRRNKADECHKEQQEHLVQCTIELQEAHKSLAVARQRLQVETEKRELTDQRLRDAVKQLKLVEQELQLEREARAVMQQKSRESEELPVRQALEVAEEMDRLRMQLRAERVSVVNHRAEAVCAQLECAVLKAYTAKMDLLQQHGYMWAVLEQRHAVLLSQEELRHTRNQASSTTLTLREQEEVMQHCCEDLCQLLRCMQRDEDQVESRQRALEDGTEARRLAMVVRSDRGDDENGKKNDSEQVSPSCDNIDGQQRVEEDHEEGQEAVWRRYRTPKTLPGVVAGLQITYSALQRRHLDVQSIADAAQSCVQQQREELASLHAQLRNLATDYGRQREELKQLWDKQAEWSQQDTLKGLLAKQKSLLAAVDKEREELHRRWAALNEEYQTLERRNSQLHERCAVKEVENARLMGVLRVKHIAPSTSSIGSDSTCNDCFTSQTADTLRPLHISSPFRPSVVVPTAPSTDNTGSPEACGGSASQTPQKRTSGIVTVATTPLNDRHDEPVPLCEKHPQVLGTPDWSNNVRKVPSRVTDAGNVVGEGRMVLPQQEQEVVRHGAEAIHSCGGSPPACPNPLAEGLGGGTGNMRRGVVA